MCQFLRQKLSPVAVDDCTQATGAVWLFNPKTNRNFLILRVIFAIYATVVVFWSLTSYIIRDIFWHWFTYFTHWGFIINATYFWSVSILHYKIYNHNKNSANSIHSNSSTPNPQNHKTSSNIISPIDTLKLGKLYKLVLISLNAGTPVAVLIIMVFWLLLWPCCHISALSLHTHGVVGFMVVVEFFTSCWQLELSQCIYPILVALSWDVLSIVFYFAGILYIQCADVVLL